MLRSENISFDFGIKDIKDFKTAMLNFYLVDSRSIKSVAITMV